VTVLAGGGVIEREGEVLLVHRPRHDDWTFPKGKLEESDESLAACALREVWDDRIAFVPRDEARELLAYERDLAVLEAL